METIILTGGGSGGHLAPIRAIAPELKKEHRLIWIGSSEFEENAAKDLDIEFKKIASGKLRRGFNMKNLLKNFFDLFKIKLASIQSFFFLIKKRPEKVFSTGGFVSVPVVLMAWLLRIPIVIHEQTIGLGLANKIALPFSKRVLLAFEDSKKYIPKRFYVKTEVVGNPIRESLLNGSKEKLEEFLNTSFDNKKPILYITGGGQGSHVINEVVFDNLEWFTENYHVIHQVGKSETKKAKEQKQINYFPFVFIEDELADIYASVDVVVTRAGAGTVNELDFFQIPSIFIPLQPSQNNEQTKNAEWFLRNNDGIIIYQNELNIQKLKESLQKMKIEQLRGSQKIKHKEDGARKMILENLV